jgi:hypothetical protein
MKYKTYSARSGRILNYPCLFTGAELTVHLRRAVPGLCGREHGGAAPFWGRAAQAGQLRKAIASCGARARKGAAHRTRDCQPDDQGDNI